MKKSLILLIYILVFHNSSYSQISVLFVNDNGINPANTTTILNVLTLSGYTYDVFDAVANMRSPSFDEMSSYDLVMWYMSSDGVGRYFWNGTDSDNTDLAIYLADGGLLCAMGTDFLYDRYATPYSFTEGEFAYDYLGIGEYHAQSYADDGFLGVPQLDLVPGNEILSLNPIQWIFPTLWYVDACTPAPGSIPVYRMGPGSYRFSGYFASIANRQNGLNTLTFFFDPALIDTQEHAISLFTGIRTYFTTVGMNSEVNNNQGATCQIFPNPAIETLLITKSDPEAGIGELAIVDIFGRTCMTLQDFHESNNQISINLTDLKSGLYFLKSEQMVVGKFIKK